MKKFLSFLILFLVLLHYRSNAQVVTKLVEESDILELTLPLADISVAELEIPSLSPLEIERLLLEDILREQNNEPYRFAATLPLSISTDDGTFVTKGENLFWSVSIAVPGAKSISLNFDYIELPEKGELYIYSSNRQILTGPFTKDNFPQGVDVVSEILSGEGISLFYSSKNQDDYKFDLSINSINVGYRSGPEIGASQKSSNSSGNSSSCNVDITEDEGDCFRASQTAAVIVLDPNALCSGSVINNTNNDHRSLILSADHCFVGVDYNSLKIRFKYWDGNSSYITYHGTNLLARQGGAVDVALLETQNAISHNVIFPGWNRNSPPSDLSNNPTSSTVLHFPKGDDMKISHDTDQTTSGEGRSSFPDDSQFVSYYSGSGSSDDFGILEPGSSGGAYYDQNHKILGPLWGTTTSNTNCDKTGFFGAFSNVASSANNVIATLDPSGTGITNLNGTFSFSGSTTIPCKEIPQNITVPPLSTNSGTSYQYNWTSNSNITIIGSGHSISYEAINNKSSGSVDWIQCDIRTPSSCGNVLVATRRIDLTWNPSIVMNVKTQNGVTVGSTFNTCPSTTTTFYPEFSNFPTPPGTSFTWSLSGSANYTSFQCSGGSCIDISPSSYGSISVTVTANNPGECIHNVSKHFSINVQSFGCINSGNTSKNKSIKIYPNPTTGNYLNIEFGETSDLANIIEIIDLQGKIVKRIIRRVDKIQKINLSALNGGLYLIRIIDGTDVFTKRVIHQPKDNNHSRL